MYYMIRPNVIFRHYDGFGYITDNSLFGYRKAGDDMLFPGERYVSETGAIMLDALDKTPRQIDEIARSLFLRFKEVGFSEFVRDMKDFYDLLIKDGFLSCGETFEECQNIVGQRLSKNRSTRGVPKSECLNVAAWDKILLKGLHIELASQCNERCVHCFIPHKYKTKKIDSTLLFRLLDEARNLNVLNVTLSGGEPLLHEDFINALSKAKELDMSVNVLSNLTLLTDAMVEEMVKNPLLSVQTSIYSMSPKTHDSITGVKGSLEKTLSSLEKLRVAGIPMQISCPIMQQNKESFAEVMAFADHKGMKVSTNYVIFASYDNTKCNLDCRLSLNDISNVFDKLATDSYMHDMCLIAEEKESLPLKSPICSVCRYYMCVSANGEAYPCVGWQGKVIGDTARQSLKEIWESSSEVLSLRNVKWTDFSRCAACADRGFCTVCMMSNANEDKDANAFQINAYHCNVASLLHEKVNAYVRRTERA